MAKSAKMSSLRKNALAILCSDIHLSHKPPIARSVEPDWYAAMARPLKQLRHLQHILEVPIVCAGDIFDKWNAPPELINFAIKHIPKNFYAIPGQHDLPFHRYEDIQKSAYWTLVKSRTITDLHPEEITSLGEGLRIYSFPWEHAVITNSRKKTKGYIDLAVIHSYIWWGEKVFKGADSNASLNHWTPKLEGYDAAVFGDNHKGFWQTMVKPSIINCGTFMRRKIDEIAYTPMVGVLLKDGDIEPWPLDCEEDKFIDVDKALAVIETALEMTEFIKELSGLGATALNFVEAVKSFMKDLNTDKEVRELVLSYLDKK